MSISAGTGLGAAGSVWSTPPYDMHVLFQDTSNNIREFIHSGDTSSWDSGSTALFQAKALSPIGVGAITGTGADPNQIYFVAFVLDDNNIIHEYIRGYIGPGPDDYGWIGEGPLASQTQTNVEVNTSLGSYSDSATVWLFYQSNTRAIQQISRTRLDTSSTAWSQPTTFPSLPGGVLARGSTSIALADWGVAVGTRIYIQGEDNYIYEYALSDMTVTQLFPALPGTALAAVAWGADSTALVSSVRVYSLATINTLQEFAWTDGSGWSIGDLSSITTTVAPYTKLAARAFQQNNVRIYFQPEYGGSVIQEYGRDSGSTTWSAGATLNFTG